MKNSSQKANFKSAGLFAKSQFILLTAFITGLTLTACSSSGSSNSSSQNNSSDFQRRIQAETAAEDQRDRNAQIQEQTRMEEVQLRKLRADRAAQRNAQRSAASQQDQ
jgi:predicted component of type VI protein secretion system